MDLMLTRCVQDPADLDWAQGEDYLVLAGLERGIPEAVAEAQRRWPTLDT